METQAKADVAVSTRAVDKAMKALDAGNPAEAASVIATAKEALAASPAMQSAAGASVREQALKLEGYASTVKDGSLDSRKAKKAIQYDNYRTQKQR
jgi:hypothetical protein